MNQKREIILLNISGDDRPGLTAELTRILAYYKVQILDIGQAVIHNTLSLGILFEVPKECGTSPVLKDLLFKGYEMGLKAKFTPIDEKDYSYWVSLQGKERYIVTLLGRKILAVHLSMVSKAISEEGLNIDTINRLSGRISLEESENTMKRACVELFVRGTPLSPENMKKQLMEISRITGIDVAFQKDDVFRRNRRLVCFDMDSTLIQTEVIVELAKAAGKGDEVHEITEAAMRGELDFQESFKQRIKLLKGVKESVLKEIAVNLPITEGAARLISHLKKFGYKTAILSGGFTYFGNYLKEVLGIDKVYANELEIKNGELTGNYLGEIVDGAKKAELLKKLAFEEGLKLEQVIAVGDGANDLPMLSLAGLGIAFHAKPIVKEQAEHSISTVGLDGILYLLGFRDREIN